MNIASQIEHSFLKPGSTLADIDNLCAEAKQYGFRSVCIPPLFIKKARSFLHDSTIKVAAAIGFPFGYSAIEAKLAEVVLAIVDGADEIDMVVNIAAIKNADWQYIAREINTIMPVIKSKQIILKVIPETGLLSDNEIITCCDIYGAAGVDFIKTSTGFITEGARSAVVALLRKHLADAVKINAGGSIFTYNNARKLLDAGASCISPLNSVEIVKESLTLNGWNEI